MRILLFILLFSLQSQAQITNNIGFIWTGGGATPPPPTPPTCGDATGQAFIDSTGITDSLIIVTVCQLVQDLKDSSLWSSLNAIYPFVGGSSSAHVWNLKNPAAYKLTFSGGWTHGSNGATPNGSTGYADTHLTPNGLLSSSSQHISYYSRTNTSGTYRDMGGGNGSTNVISMAIKWSDNNGYFNVGASYSFTGVSSSAGYFISNKIASGTANAYNNGSQISTRSSADTDPAYSIYIGAWNSSGSAGGFSPRQVAFATIGAGLSAAQASTLNFIVEKFNDALSRGVQ